MNRDILLNCLEYTGVLSATSVVGLYSFSSGLSGACFNQLYSSGDNYYNNLPYDEAYPLIYAGSGNQPSGLFSKNNPYYIKKNYSGNFGALISMNYSGCLNSGNHNYILLSSTSGLKDGNPGIVLGITPSNRLFFNTNNYYSTISQEISTNDFAFISVEQNRFVNFGLFNLKDYTFHRKIYDHESETLTIEKLYFGGALNYNLNSTGYSGKLNEIYLFSGNLIDPLLNYCIDCIYATGFEYNQYSTVYTGVRITGSYWSGEKEIQVTGSEKVIGNYIKTDGSTGYFYYESGKTGEVQIYESLFPEFELALYSFNDSGIQFSFDTGKKFNQTSFNTFFDLGLYSGDIVEVYTYPQFNENLNLEIINNEFPDSPTEVQLFGNGLAETNGIDYLIDYNRQISGFNEDDILLYDLLTGSSVTVPFLTGYINTGNQSNESLIDVVSISGNVTFGLGLNAPFNWDIYLNGQKLIESINYYIQNHYHPDIEDYENHIILIRSFNDINNFNNLNDPSEFKLVPLQKNPIKSIRLISGDSFYLNSLTGFSEQIWRNGIRQKRGVDYFKENTCSSQFDSYSNPNYSFELLNSNNNLINSFIKTENFLENYVTEKLNNSVKYLEPFSNQKVNPHQMFSYFERTGNNIHFIRNSGFFLSGFSGQLSCVNVASNDYNFGNPVSVRFSSNIVQSGLLSKTCIALTKRHVILPNTVFSTTYDQIDSLYNQIQTGKTIYFLTKNNQLISRILETGIFYNSGNWANYQFFGVGLLDSDLPEDVEPCYILPSGYKEYFTNSPNEDFIYPESFPCYSLDNYRCIYVQNLYSIGKNRLKFVFKDEQRLSTLNLLKHFDFTDAGCPFFTFIDNKFVLLSISDGRTSFGQGPNIAEFNDFITNSISILNQSKNIQGDYSLNKVKLNFDKKNYSPKKLNYLYDHIDNSMLSFLDDYTRIYNPFSLYETLPPVVSSPIPITRNTGHILNSLNEKFSCWSPWQNYEEPTTRRNSLLITPRHIFLPGHFSIPNRELGYLNGELLPPELQFNVKFVTKDNTAYSGKIIARYDLEYSYYNSETDNIKRKDATKSDPVFFQDAHILLLDSDISEQIKPIVYLPEDYNQYFFISENESNFYPPFLSVNTNLYQEYSIGERNSTPITIPNERSSYAGAIFDPILLSSRHSTMGGDSSSFGFYVINGKIVFPSVAFEQYQEAINRLNSIHQVQGDYNLKTIDLNNFDKIENKFSLFEIISSGYPYYKTPYPYQITTKFYSIDNKFIFNKDFI